MKMEMEMAMEGEGDGDSLVKIEIDRLRNGQQTASIIVRFCFAIFFFFIIQHCFFCSPLDFTVSVEAGIEPRTVASFALAARRSNHSARSHMPPLRFYCVGGCWDQTQDCCDFGTGSQALQLHG